MTQLSQNLTWELANPRWASILNPIIQNVGNIGQIIGSTNSEPADQGKVGEVIEIRNSLNIVQSSPVLGTIYDLLGVFIPLTSGAWTIYVHAALGADWSSGAGTVAYSSLILRDASNNQIQNAVGQYTGDNASNLFVPRFGVNSVSFIATVRLNNPTIFKLSMSINSVSGSPVYSAVRIRGDFATTYLIAIRAR